MLRRVLTILLLVAGLLLPAAGAWADPAGPTDYRSTITGIEPDVDGITLEVFGGDAFLVLTVEPGVEVLVHGYAHDPADGVVDPYLRFDADGTVWANRRSPARWQNEDRYAATEVPDFVDPNAPADWEQVGDGGTYAWHDHRIHWMSPDLPPAVDPDGGVQDVFGREAPVPMQVDGVPVEAFVRLEWIPPSSPLPWVAIALVVAVAGFAVARRPELTPWVVVGAGGVALAVSVASATGLPAGVGRAVPPLLLPPVAIAGGLLARTREGDARTAVSALGALPLLGWAAVQSGALTAAVVPSVVPVEAVRVAVAISAGAGLAVLAAAAAGLLGGDLSSLADLADEDA